MRKLNRNIIFLALYGLWILFVVNVLTGCQTPKSAATPMEQQELAQMLEDQSFYFEAQWAMPLQTQALTALHAAGMFRPGSSVSRININKDGHFLQLEGGKAKANLPYYGQRDTYTDYAHSRDWIEFDTDATDYELQQDSDSRVYDLDLNAKRRSETFQFNLRVFPNRRTIVTVFSSQRDIIRYEGFLKPLPEQ